MKTEIQIPARIIQTAPTRDLAPASRAAAARAAGRREAPAARDAKTSTPDSAAGATEIIDGPRDKQGRIDSIEE